MTRLAIQEKGYAAKRLKRFVMLQEPTTEYIPSVVLKKSADVSDLMRTVFAASNAQFFQENFFIAFLNRASRCVGYSHISIGGLTGTVADPRIIAVSALLSGCVSVILCHNHPSGNLTPSRADEDITMNIKQTLSFADIKVLDHIIITEDNGYYSFADEGIL